MDILEPNLASWLSKQLGGTFDIRKHTFSNQDEVYVITVSEKVYYLKTSQNLESEYANLQLLSDIVPVPTVLAYQHGASNVDYLLMSEVPGNNLVELLDSRSTEVVVHLFAKAVRQFHDSSIKSIFPHASSDDVLLHGDMSMPNVIISATDEIGYIDVGRASHGSRDDDLADAIWSLQRNLGPGYGERFLELYGFVARSPKIEEALSYVYKPSSGD